MRASQVLAAADVVAHAEIGDVVVQRVDREVAAHRVFLDRAVDVVAHDAAVDEMAIAAAVVAGAAERRDLDDLAAEHDVREAEAPADQPAVAEQAAHLLGRRVGRDVEILRVSAEQQVAHGAADQEGRIAGFVQAVEHAQRAVGDVLARNAVLRARRAVHFDASVPAALRWDSFHRSFHSQRRGAIAACFSFRYTTRPLYFPRPALPSSSGLGHRPLKAGTRVRTS